MSTQNKQVHRRNQARHIRSMAGKDKSVGNAQFIQFLDDLGIVITVKLSSEFVPPQSETAVSG